MAIPITTPETKLYSSCREAITAAFFEYRAVFDRVYDRQSLRRDAHTLGDMDVLENLVESELNRPERALANILYEFNTTICAVEQRHGLVSVLASGRRGPASKGIMNLGMWGAAISCAWKIPYIGIPVGLVALGVGHSIYTDYSRREHQYREDAQKTYSCALEKMHGLVILQETTKAKGNMDPEGLNCLKEICSLAGIDPAWRVEESALVGNGSLNKLSKIMSGVKPMFSWGETSSFKKH